MLFIRNNMPLIPWFKSIKISILINLWVVISIQIPTEEKQCVFLLEINLNEYIWSQIFTWTCSKYSLEQKRPNQYACPCKICKTLNIPIFHSIFYDVEGILYKTQILAIGAKGPLLWSCRSIFFHMTRRGKYCIPFFAFSQKVNNHPRLRFTPFV